jgi:hypothetical protein
MVAAARTLEALAAAVGALLGTFTAQECANYFANVGCGQAQRTSRFNSSIWDLPCGGSYLGVPYLAHT